MFTRRDALAMLNAVDHNGDYAYFADETKEWYMFTTTELDNLVSCMNHSDEQIAHSAYSHWCSSNGSPITDPSEIRDLTRLS